MWPKFRTPAITAGCALQGWRGWEGSRIVGTWKGGGEEGLWGDDADDKSINEVTKCTNVKRNRDQYEVKSSKKVANIVSIAAIMYQLTEDGRGEGGWR
jgi:hypothetical protein